MQEQKIHDDGEKQENEMVLHTVQVEQQNPTQDVLRERHEPGWRLPSAEVAEFGAALLVVVEKEEE